jgi:inner membrane protein
MKSFAMRAGMYLAAMVLLWIGVTMVAGIVSDRLQHKHVAQASISQSHAGAQLLAGPTLILETTETWMEAEMVGQGEKRKLERTEKSEIRRHVVLPDSLAVSGDVQIEPKKRGIFAVNAYTASVTLKGTLHVPMNAELPREHAGKLVINPLAQALIGVSEARGLRTVTLALDGKPLEVAPDTERIGGLSSARATLDLKALAGRDIPFVATVQLTGTESIAVLPLGRQNTVQLKSNWPSPAFEGAALPVQKSIGEKGFDATWQVTSLASEARQQWAGAVRLAGEPTAKFDINGQAVSVRMIDRLDIYTFTDRATKYGILFIALTLAAYALFEMFKQVRVHPVQILLVGAALVLFFLLLLSLSEQIGFALAYAIAAVACVGLIGYYSGHILGGFARSLPLTFGLAGLYGALYLLLHSEDNALLLGTVMLFALLSAVMVATRKVNWYALLDKKPAADADALAQQA